MISRNFKKLLHRRQTTSRLMSAYALSDKKSFLRQVGWFESVYQLLPVDREGQPLPWFTYPAKTFLESRINSNMTVFEYGAGNSTLWWSSKVASVVSCEHDEQWHQTILNRLPTNVTCLHIPLEHGEAYSRTAMETGKRFDLLVIDGRDRVNCARYAVEALTEQGVIVWDNSDREEYRQGYDFLQNEGFKRLDFFGMGPVNRYAWCTSIFYRTENCLGI